MERQKRREEITEEIAWEQTHGPYGGFITGLLAAPDGTLYVGIEGGGAFRSEDAGESWTEINTGLTNVSHFSSFVKSFAVSGATLYAGTLGGVFRSEDKGNRWTHVSAGLTTLSARSLVVLGPTLYAGGGGVFRSDDGGDSWTEINAGLTNLTVSVLAVLGTTLYAGTPGGGVFRWDDHSGAWIHTGFADRAVWALAALGKSLYASAKLTGPGKIDDTVGLFRSDDGGESWTRIWYHSVWALAISETTLYASPGNGVFRSLDGGKSWTQTGLENINVGSLEFAGNILYAGSGGGVFRLENGAVSWSQVNNGLTATEIHSFAVLGETIYAGTRPCCGIFRSEDGGNSWTQVNTGLTHLTVRSLAILGETIYAGTDEGFFRSVDKGDSWWQTGSRGLCVWSMAVLGETLYAGTSNGVYRSEDRGDSWMRVNQGSMNTHAQALVVLGKTLYAGTYRDGVFRSEDGGDSWTEINTGLTDLVINTFAVLGETLYAGTYRGGIFRLENGGNSWTQINTGLTTLNVCSLAVLGKTLYAGAYSGGVFRSEDRGNSWTQVGLTNLSVLSFVALGDALYAGTRGSGVFRASLSEEQGFITSGISEKKEITEAQIYGGERLLPLIAESLPVPPRKSLSRDLQIAHVAEKYRAIAHYRFDENPNDSLGRSAPFAMKNVQYSDNGLYLNGIYLIPIAEGEGYEAIATIEDLDYECFSIKLEFCSLEFDDTDGDRCHILTGGSAYRWFGLRRTPHGNLEVTLDSQEFRNVFHNSRIAARQWHEVICSVDIRKRAIKTMLDGLRLDHVTLPADFTLEVLSSEYEDREFTFTDYSNGTTFYGYIGDFQIFGKALSWEEMQTLYNLRQQIEGEG